MNNEARNSGNEFMNNGARKSGNEFPTTEPGSQGMSKTMEPGSQENAGRSLKCFYNPGRVYIISK